MLFLDGVDLEGPDAALTFRWVKAPTSAELTALAGRIAERVGRFLERQGLLERDRENPCLAELALDDEPMEALLAHSIAYRIAVGPRARVGLRGFPRSGQFIPVFPSCCGRLEASAGDRLGSKGDTVRIAATASRFWRRRRPRSFPSPAARGR